VRRVQCMRHVHLLTCARLLQTCNDEYKTCPTDPSLVQCASGGCCPAGQLCDNSGEVHTCNDPDNGNGGSSSTDVTDTGTETETQTETETETMTETETGTETNITTETETETPTPEPTQPTALPQNLLDALQECSNCDDRNCDFKPFRVSFALSP